MRPTPMKEDEQAASVAQCDRKCVVLLDKFGYDTCRHSDGASFFPPQDYRVRLVTAADKLSEADRPEIEAAVGVSAYDDEAIIDAARELYSAGHTKAEQFVTITEMLIIPIARLREEL